MYVVLNTDVVVGINYEYLFLVKATCNNSKTVIMSCNRFQCCQMNLIQ